MSTTLTLSIPFILLGRRDTNILDPSFLTDHERAIEPIKLISQTLQHFCPTIPIAHRALTTFDSQATPPRNSPPAKDEPTPTHNDKPRLQRRRIGMLQPLAGFYVLRPARPCF